MESRQDNSSILRWLLDGVYGMNENSFDVPSAMLESQKASLREELANNLKSQGLNTQKLEEYFDKWGADIQKKAEYQVRSGLILDALAREYGIEVVDADLESKYTVMANQS